MVVYYYCHEGGLFILKDGQLKLSPPSSFNDPFEFSPKSIETPDLTKERGIKMMRGDPDTWFERWGKIHVSPDKQEALEYLRTHEDQIINQMMQKAPQNVEDMKEGFLKTTSGIYAIACFSKRYDSILMWSHYAKKHSGMIIGFDTKVAPFNKPRFLDYREVKYSKERPIFVHRDNVPEFKKSFDLVAESKSDDWSYEQEVRIIVPLNVLEQGGFLRLMPESLVCVIYGCRCNALFRYIAYHHLIDPVLQHVAIYEAKQHKTEYKLDFIQLRKGSKPTGILCAVNRQPSFYLTDES